MEHGIFLEFERTEGLSLSGENLATKTQMAVPVVITHIDEINLYCTECEQLHWYFPGQGRGKFQGGTATCPNCGVEGKIEFSEPFTAEAV